MKNDNMKNDNTMNNESAFFALFNESEEGKSLAERKAKEEQQRLERVLARNERILNNVHFLEGFFNVSLPNLAELIEKLFDMADYFRVGKFFLVPYQEFPRQNGKAPVSDEKYLVKFGAFDKVKKVYKVEITDATEDGPIDKAVRQKKANDAATTKAKAIEEQAARLAFQKEQRGRDRVNGLKEYLKRIFQKETELSEETIKFLMEDLPHLPREFKGSRQEVISYMNDIDSKSFPENIPDDGPFAVMTPVLRRGENVLFIFIPEINTKNVVASQFKKFLSEEQVSTLMENLPGDSNTWYGSIWVRRGKDNFLGYSEGIAKALRLESGQIAYDLLQGVVKVVQPAGKTGNKYIMANPDEPSCFIVEKPDGKMIPNLYLPD